MSAGAHAGVDRDDPAGEHRVADPLEPGAIHHQRQTLGRREALHRLGQVGVGLAVAGEPPQQRHQAVEPQREEGRERGPLRLGDLEDHKPPAGLQNPGQLDHSAVEVGEVADAEADGDRVEGAVVVGERERVPVLEAHRRTAALGALAAGELEHPLGEVRADHAALWTHPPGELEGEVAGAAAGVEGAVARLQLRTLGGALTPAVMKAGGHRRVHQVVDPGDAVEHAADLPRERLLIAYGRGGGAH